MRLAGRDTLWNEILGAVDSYEIIESYADDTYLPRYLILATTNKQKNRWSRPFGRKVSMSDPVALASLVMASISALSDAVVLVRSIISKGGSPDPQDVAMALQNKPVPHSASAALAAIIVDDEILEEIVEKIKGEKDRLRKAISERDPARRQRELDEVDQNICDQLSIIKRLNGGVLPSLPGSDLYRLWVSHRCK